MSWGLGIVFLWIGLDILVHPTNWIGFLPENIPLGLSRERALFLNGIADAVAGSLLILHWWPRLISGYAILHLLGILVTNGIDAVIIRDVGLLGIALALFFWPTHYRRHRWWKFWQRSSSSYTEEEE